MKPLELSSARDAVNWLLYSSYAFQRSNAPHIEPERWKHIYDHAETYEEIYQEKRHDLYD